MEKYFISYSRSDTAFAKKIVDTLGSEECWIDWEGIHAGDDFWEKVKDRIVETNIFIFLISKTSIVQSKVCIDEFIFADEHDKKKISLFLSQNLWLLFTLQFF